MNKKARGRAAEEAAATFLTRQGFVILHRNYRVGRLEIDIVAAEGPTLVVAEVKTASADMSGVMRPVRQAQEERLKEAAEALLNAHPEYSEVRMDLVLVHFEASEPLQVVHLRDAFGAMH